MPSFLQIPISSRYSSMQNTTTQKMATKDLFFLFLLSLNSCHGLSTFEKDVTFTHAQKQALDKFKTIMISRLEHDYMKTDLYLSKWLRARNFDIPAAERSLLQHLKWRKLNKMDSALKEDFSDLRSLYKHYVNKNRDKDGQPVLYFDVAGMDIRRAVLAGESERLLQYSNAMLEDACTVVRHLGDEYGNITRGHLMINAKGYNVVQHGCLRCIPILLRIVINYEDNYPLCADQIIAANTPDVIAPLLEAVKPLLSQTTRDSLKIFGMNQKKLLSYLTKYFDLDEIPVQLGGKKVLEDLESDYE